jgi:hypothetical protein
MRKDDKKIDSTPPDHHARRIRESLEAWAATIRDDPIRSALGRTVHANFEATAQQAAAALAPQEGDGISAAQLQSLTRGLISLAVREEMKWITDIAGVCETPAEARFAIGLETVIKAGDLVAFWKLPGDEAGAKTLFGDIEQAQEDGIDQVFEIEPQAMVGEEPGARYRLDFLIKSLKVTGDRSSPIRQVELGVEIDGRLHATDASRAHDAERDDFLASRGIIVRRFTGKQIYDDPYGCASRVIERLLTS